MTVDRGRCDHTTGPITHDGHGAAAAAPQDVLLGAGTSVPDRARLVIRRGDNFISSCPSYTPDAGLVGFLYFSFGVEHGHLVVDLVLLRVAMRKAVAAAGEVARGVVREPTR